MDRPTSVFALLPFPHVRIDEQVAEQTLKLKGGVKSIAHPPWAILPLQGSRLAVWLLRRLASTGLCYCAIALRRLGR